MSPTPTADARVSVTSVPETETPLTLTALPAASTANRSFAGTEPPLSTSSKVSVRVSPSTDAALTAGRTPSNLRVSSASSPAWARPALTPPPLMVPPLSSSVFATTATPSEASDSLTTYENRFSLPLMLEW